MSITYIDAVQSLAPDKYSMVNEHGEVRWKEGVSDVPTEEAIEEKLTELQAEYDAQEYARNRASEYPSLSDVTVALAEKAEGNSQMWDTITAERLVVKAKFPK